MLLALSFKGVDWNERSYLAITGQSSGMQTPHKAEGRGRGLTAAARAGRCIEWVSCEIDCHEKAGAIPTSFQLGEEETLAVWDGVRQTNAFRDSS